MSGTQIPTKAQAEQAYAYMLDEIHVPAFFEKLASNGIEARNEAESKQLLQLGAVLAQRETAGAEKTAKDGNPFLAHVLNRLEPTGPAQVANVSASVKRGSDELVRTNELTKNAALIYAHAVSGGELAPDAVAEQPAE